jgi:hypothetical protein
LIFTGPIDKYFKVLYITIHHYTLTIYRQVF